MELTGKATVGKQCNNKSMKNNNLSKMFKETNQENQENNFDKGLKTLNPPNVLIVVRGLIALLLEMDFTCNMDQFLLTSKVSKKRKKEEWS